MSQIDERARAAVNPTLGSTETILWAGRPCASVIFHQRDIYLIPFSLLWGGFAIFWESMASHASLSKNGPPQELFLLFGAVAVLIGQYIIWGRFVYSAWKKRRTFYAVTNERVIVVHNGWRHLVVSTYIDSLPTLAYSCRWGGQGTVRFVPAPELFPRRRMDSHWDELIIGDVPVFLDIPDAIDVYHLVAELREKASTSLRQT